MRAANGSSKYAVAVSSALDRPAGTTTGSQNVAVFD